MLLTLRDVGIDHGSTPLIEHAELRLERGERVCLVGRNGAGKTTLLRLLAGELQPDHGEVHRAAGLRVGYLPQDAELDLEGSVFDVVAAGLGELGALLTEFHHVSLQLATGEEPRLLARLAEVQHALDAAGGWEQTRQVETTLSRLSLPADAKFVNLSGGERRRVLLARALVIEPDLLLLDEPTNHLDLPAISWLEEFLLGYGGALLFITHDRTFLQRLATRIIDLDRGTLTSWPGDYATYRRRREAALAAEVRQQAEFDKKLSAEETWIRQGVQARRTRNEGRVRALLTMRAERQQRRQRSGAARLAVEQAAPSGKRVVEIKGLVHAFGERLIVAGLTTTIIKGDKVGIIGPNGVGKTTLLRLMLGELAPQQGSVRLGTGLQVAYFDQHRVPLDRDRSLIDVVGHGREEITINGRSRHVISYLQDFLFTPAQARAPIRTLSGGERNRGLLARLFSQPSNVLVMDEPTNDLDIETLELLEELLADYAGTLLLVSHDRAFIDNAVTSTLVMSGDGRVEEFVGGYSDWLRQRAPESGATARKKPKAPVRPATPKARKLGYREQQELDALPARIEALEQELETLQQALADPDCYRDGGEVARDLQTRLQGAETVLETAFARWDELEGAHHG